ncbi:MAG: phosphorylase, partial [Thermodesulfobacteriota bacterium]
MEQPIIQATKSPGEPDINGPCLLLVNPFEAHYAATMVKKKHGAIHRLFHCQLMSFNQEGAAPSYWAGPTVGAPMAVMTLEKLIALGCQKLLVMAWCGALVPELSVGDIFLPTWGQSEEGVSAHYPLTKQPQASTTLLTKLQNHFPDAQQGPIWTTDAPYRELPS